MRKASSAQRSIREIVNRLRWLSDDELEVFIESERGEQAALLWLAACRAYRFIREFAVEVLNERFLSLRTDITYDDFDAFLAAFNHDKRKKIKQERKALGRHGLSFEWLSGSAIEPEHWRFFERCYRTTYHAHHSHPYLNLAFFETLGATMAEQILLVLARQDGTPVAAALNLFDARNLYGRYWGSVADIPGLHFETCYYQAIEFCIARKLAHFDAGAQGRHKLARGFVPRETRSAHWLAHAEFSLAVERYLAHEAQAVGEYVGELEQRSPFRRTNG